MRDSIYIILSQRIMQPSGAALALLAYLYLIRERPFLKGFIISTSDFASERIEEPRCLCKCIQLVFTCSSVEKMIDARAASMDAKPSARTAASKGKVVSELTTTLPSA